MVPGDRWHHLGRDREGRKKGLRVRVTGERKKKLYHILFGQQILDYNRIL